MCGIFERVAQDASIAAVAKWRYHEPGCLDIGRWGKTNPTSVRVGPRPGGIFVGGVLEFYFRRCELKLWKNIAIFGFEAAEWQCSFVG